MTIELLPEIFYCLGNAVLLVSLHKARGKVLQSAGESRMPQPPVQLQLYCVRANGTCHTDNMGASQSDNAQAPAGKADLVSRIKARVASADPKKAQELGGVFLFNIIKGTSVYSWTLDLNNVTVYEGEPEEDPDTTFTLNEHYFKQLVQGKEDARAIMQAGRCSVTGDIMRAMKLEPYIKLE